MADTGRDDRLDPSRPSYQSVVRGCGFDSGNREARVPIPRTLTGSFFSGWWVGALSSPWARALVFSLFGVVRMATLGSIRGVYHRACYSFKSENRETEPETEEHIALVATGITDLKIRKLNPRAKSPSLL